MPDTPTLRILQQNVNKSNTAQFDLLHSASPDDYDIIAIQEPYIDHLKNTRATAHWRVVYPAVADTDAAPRARSILLVNRKLSTNTWSPLRIPHSDITAITLTTAHATIALVNTYIDADHDTAIHATARALTRWASRDRAGEAGMIWLGDFNRHHPSWDSISNAHLFTRAHLDKAEVLLTKLADLDLRMALPASIPTLEATRTKNHTRPDNVFCTDMLLDHLTACDTKPDLRPACTDHFPIATTLAIPTQPAPPRAQRNFGDVDWDEFRTELGTHLQERPPRVITTTQEFDTELRDLMDAIHRTVEAKVPLSPDTPYAKR